MGEGGEVILYFRLQQKRFQQAKGPPHLSNTGDVCVVPSVVVHQDGPVRHGRDLVPVVPPRHHLGILWGVLTEPIVSLSEVIKYDTRAVMLRGREHDGWGGVSLGCNLGGGAMS